MKSSPPGIVVHRRSSLTAKDVTRRHGIPVTNPVCTLIDLAAGLDADGLEAAVSAADKLGLTDPERLRAAIDDAPRRPGTGALRRLLDRDTLTVTDSVLEREFLRVARTAGLSRPLTGQECNGYKVDFCWPELGLVVETDGLRYHRTPAQQGRDRVRDQMLTAAGLTVLRFTRAQVAFDPEHVSQTLAVVARRLKGSRP